MFENLLVLKNFLLILFSVVNESERDIWSISVVENFEIYF